MKLHKLIAILAVAFSLCGSAAQARTFDYCEDSSGETLSLLIKIFHEMLDDPDTTALERKRIDYQIERLQDCQVYKDYIETCGKYQDHCAP